MMGADTQLTAAARLQLAVHRVLRYALPRRVRAQRGGDMDRTFLYMLQHDRRGWVRLWAGEVRDLLGTGLKRGGHGGGRRPARRRRQSWAPRSPNLGMSWLDVKMGLRMLMKHPGLTVVAVLALAVGIPTGLAPWHLVNAVEGPLPVEEGAEVVLIRYWNQATQRPDVTRIDDLAQWSAGLESFENIGAARRAVYNVGVDDEGVQAVGGAAVTASTFDLLRTPPLHGRTIVAADEVAGAPDVVVIGYHFWRTRFNADPEMVGKTLRIGGTLHTVVGVMPEGFLFPVRGWLWLPLRESPDERPFEGRPLWIYGRLAEGVSAAQAQTELATVTQRLAREFPVTHERLIGEVVPFALILTGSPAGGMRSELGFVVVQVLTLLLLIVACTNVGMLIFARTATRTQELAVRVTLGAGRARIVGQMFTETLVLALVAVGVGLLLTDVGMRLLQQWFAASLPYWVDLGVSWGTSMRALALAVPIAALAGIIPALRVSGKAVQKNIQGGAVSLTGTRFGGVSTFLIVGDVALAIIIISVAMAGLHNLSTMNSNDALGIRVDEYLSADVMLSEQQPAAGGGGATTSGNEFEVRLAATQQSLVERLRAEPGVLGVAIGDRLPRMDHPGRRIELEGESPEAEGFGDHEVQVARVDVGFFDGLGTPILRGRGFDGRDIGDNRSTVIVNTTFVDSVLGGRNPIGMRLRYAGGTQPAAASFRRTGEPGPWLEIIGVVGRLGMNMVAPANDAGIYHPVAPGDLHPLHLGIHLNTDPGSFAPRLRELVAEVDANAAAMSLSALGEVVQDDLITVYMIGVGGAAMVGILVLLAASGIYAIMSFTVAARTREIGIRTSLGAKRRDVVRTISGRALAQLGGGAFFGLAAAWWLLADLKRGAGWIPEYSPLGLALLAAAGVVLLIGMPACLVPTLRALRVLPTEAMRGS